MKYLALFFILLVVLVGCKQAIEETPEVDDTGLGEVAVLDENVDFEDPQTEAELDNLDLSNW